MASHRGINLLRQEGSWPSDQWHDRSAVGYIYHEMDSRRHDFRLRRRLCLAILGIVGITALVIAPTSQLAAFVVFIGAVIGVFNYYQNNLSEYFRDPYNYELLVVENSLGQITEHEAAQFAEIILTRRELDQLRKRIAAIHRNNFLFVEGRKK